MGDIERAREPYSPDMSDAANYIALLAMERDGLQLLVADLERRLAATSQERDSWKDGAETLAMQVKDLQREIAEMEAVAQDLFL